MKPPVSSSSHANACAQNQCKAPDNQCSFTGKPVSACVKAVVRGDACQNQLNGQADTSCVGGAIQVSVAESLQNGKISTCSQNGAERLSTNETHVNGRLDVGSKDDAEEADTTEAQQGSKVDVNSECATGGLPFDDDEDLDKQLEAAYSGGTTVDTKDDDNFAAEDWETEITTPFYIVPKKPYLFGKKVFVPSDLHAATTRRGCPQFKVVEGQFDDADM
nr:uncharacterized protein LOC126525504 [Dermacentor andersoni]XP_054923692.1 uncharacterized protein LOC126525504 [Dermacentor andersoni]XP_054923693.1 uncharacterized protein LOC126525504 [Dermacentor andersoni]